MWLINEICIINEILEVFEELVQSTLILRSQDEDRIVEELFVLFQPEAGHNTNCHIPIGNNNLYEIYLEQLICFAEYNFNKFNTTVFVRIQYDILHSGSGARNGDSRNGGERHRRCPRERGFGGDIVEPSQHKKNGPGTSQRNRLLTFIFTRDTKTVHGKKRNHYYFSCHV